MTTSKWEAMPGRVIVQVTDSMPDGDTVREPARIGEVKSSSVEGLTAGDVVMFGKYAGIEVPGESRLLVLDEREVLGRRRP